MTADDRERRPRREIPGWFIGIAVIATMLVTAFVVMQRNPDRWPAQAVEMPTLVAQEASPMMAIGRGSQPYQVVAATAPAQPPTIRAGQPPIHEDRGACATCHQVVDTVGNAIPAISAYSSLPHPYNGGLCINCHRTIPAPAGNILPMAATRVPPAPMPAAPAQPTEAAWLGMEVSPITRVTAQQYQIPAGTAGVVVAEVEAQAQTAGLQAGDVVVAVDNQPVTDMLSFTNVTRNGGLEVGSVIVLRAGQQLQVMLDSRPAAAAAAPAAQRAPVEVAPDPGTAGSGWPQPLAGAPPSAAWNNGVPVAGGRGGGRGGGTCTNNF